MQATLASARVILARTQMSAASFIISSDELTWRDRTWTPVFGSSHRRRRRSYVVGNEGKKNFMIVTTANADGLCFVSPTNQPFPFSCSGAAGEDFPVARENRLTEKNPHSPRSKNLVGSGKGLLELG